MSEETHKKLKKLFGKVRKQMEFYFSDSNLVKDKFLSNLISKDPDGFVELEIFKKFNKIKAFTNSSEVIISAISRSNMFEISNDKKKVRRITPVELTKDFDACTLYVEKLPINADQKWVKDVLGQFGTVKYVNVPRFKVTKKIKGFAFVEFENPEGVKNACEFYKMSSEKECSASEDESKIYKYAKKHKQEENLSDKKNRKSRTRSVSDSSDKVSDFLSLKSDQHENISDNDIDSEHSKRKRKCEDSLGESSIKKSKETDSEDPSTSTNIFNTDLAELKKESDSMQSNIQEDSKNENVAEIKNDHLNGTKIEESKLKRKRKKSKKNHSNTEKPSLRVMPKSEWKTYRNKYLELQRTTMSLLKKHIFLETQELKEQETQIKSMDVPEMKKTFQFTPGVIIKVKLSEPIKNPSEIKNQVKANVVVAYIDAPLGSDEIFIRCHNSEEAEVIIKEEKLNHLGKLELIQGDEEKNYWEKIETDRKNKYENPVPHKKRGRDKILAKAAKLEEMKNKHIYFDE